jgi:hypothetical protein
MSAPAFYAKGGGDGGLRDWITLLHPPYTLWHLSYVAIGASLVERFELWRLGGTLAAFFLAVGIGAHALDELNGRPLRTGISRGMLIGAATISIAGACVMGVLYGGLRLLPFVAVGVVLVLGYNLELLGGRLHNDLGFAAAWGAFPVLVGAYAQDWSVSPAACVAAGAALLLSLAQRALSTPARTLRRRVDTVSVRVRFVDGSERQLGSPELLAPLERALRALTGAVVLLAVAAVLARTGA